MTESRADIAGRPRKRWLCIAYAFPPINRSGTHRTLAFVRHLDRLGWDASVLTVDPRGEPLDGALLDDVPASTVIHRTAWVDRVARVKAMIPFRRRRSEANVTPESVGDSSVRTAHANVPGRSLRDWLTRWLQTPDSRTGWVAPAVRAGLREIAAQRPDVIFSTSPYMSAHLIALRLARRTGLPWVADFRDPWTANPFRTFAYRSLRWWDARQERQVVSHADQIVCATAPMSDELCRRYPSVQEKCSTILNGIDVERFDRIDPIRVVAPDQVAITHVGQFYGRRSPLTWFDALGRALRSDPKMKATLRLVLVGPDSFQGRSLSAWAADRGVGEFVRVLGPRSHREALGVLAGSDVLALVASSGPGADLQVPNKLFEYLAIKKPIVATCSPANPIREILAAARAKSIVCEPDDVSRLSDSLLAAATGRLRDPQQDWSGVERFDRARRGEELAAVFERVVHGRAAGPLGQGVASRSAGSVESVGPLAGVTITSHPA